MSNVTQLIVTIKESLAELARQTNELALGLERVSPLQSASSSLSIQYLKAVSKELDSIVSECDSMILPDVKMKKER